MGCYNSVTFKCPNCSAKIETQTKAGDCDLAEYRAGGVPLGDASGLVGNVVECGSCGVEFTIACKTTRVALTLEDVAYEDWE